MTKTCIRYHANRDQVGVQGLGIASIFREKANAKSDNNQIAENIAFD